MRAHRRPLERPMLHILTVLPVLEALVQQIAVCVHAGPLAAIQAWPLWGTHCTSVSVLAGVMCHGNVTPEIIH